MSQIAHPGPLIRSVIAYVVPLKFLCELPCGSVCLSVQRRTQRCYCEQIGMNMFVDELHLTAWYPRKTKPTRVGVYRCRYPKAGGNGKEGFATWTGTHWTPVSASLDDLRPAKKRAKRQKMRWRGLTQLGAELLSSAMEEARLAQVADENVRLLAEVRATEVELSVAVDATEGHYLQLLDKCAKDPRLAAAVRKHWDRSDLSTLRPSLQGTAYVAYAELSDATLDEKNASLSAALVTAKNYGDFLKHYWDATAEAIRKLGKKGSDRELDSRGLVVNLPERQDLFNRAVAPKPAYGNFAGGKG